MAAGFWTWFDIATEKFVKGDITWDHTNFNIVLTTDAQVLTPDFSGVSGDCRYSDLTAELPTADGYTTGGLALTGLLVSRVGGMNTWSSVAPAWSLTDNITLKYAVIFDADTPNDDLLCYLDCDIDGGSITTVDNFLSFVTGGGILRARRP